MSVHILQAVDLCVGTNPKSVPIRRKRRPTLANVIKETSKAGLQEAGERGRAMTVLPASLSAALDRLFAKHPLASHVAVAVLLSVSCKTLHRLGDDRIIFYRLRGTSRRCYAREDIERYWGTTQCQSTGNGTSAARSPRRSSTMTSSSSSRRGNVVAFTAQLARERNARRKRMKPQSDNMPPMEL
jgi:hypothetical protein